MHHHLANGDFDHREALKGEDGQRFAWLRNLRHQAAPGSAAHYFNAVHFRGNERAPDGVEMANTWQGTFPIQNTQADGYAKRSPVRCFPANDFGLYDMIGNVGEWTNTLSAQTQVEAVYTIKGGSFLCAPNFCRRYRAAARQAQEAGLPTSHIGFRTVSK